MPNNEQERAMLTHQQVWDAIEILATRHGLTASGLARRSGLDPTTFNKSKRVGSDGRQRWPSTESVAKILEATNVSLDEFLALLREAGGEGQPGSDGFEEAGQAPYRAESVRPVVADWGAIDFPGTAHTALLVLEAVGDDLQPVYRTGDRLVCRKGAKVVAGDRIVIADRNGSLLVRDLIRRSRGKLTLQGWNPKQQGHSVLNESEIDWTAKILWASQ